MKKSLVIASVAALAGATLLLGASPAMAHDRFGLAVSVGIPAPVIVAPAPVYYPAAPAPVVYGEYGPIVRVGAPYYYGRDWRYERRFYPDHGYRGGYYHGDRGDHGYHGGHR